VQFYFYLAFMRVESLLLKDFIVLDKKNLSIMSSVVGSDTPVAEKTGLGSAKPGRRILVYDIS
jgi:hypothetical protein